MQIQKLDSRGNIISIKEILNDPPDVGGYVQICLDFSAGGFAIVGTGLDSVPKVFNVVAANGVLIANNLA